MRILCKYGHARDASRAGTFTSRGKKNLWKEVAMLGERMCNLHSIRLGDLAHYDTGSVFAPVKIFIYVFQIVIYISSCSGEDNERYLFQGWTHLKQYDIKLEMID